MTFETLGLADSLVRAVHEQGYTQPTPIQLQAIPAVLNGGDLLAGIACPTIVICGTDFSTTPRSSVYAAANRDFRMVLATDAISGATDAGLNELAQIGVYLMSTDKLLDWLLRSRQAA